VSVVVPVYNRRELVRGAIESVLAQTRRDWELILVDDASDDDPGSVLSEYRDDRLRSVRRSKNGGVSAAQNTGLDAATGRYVAFLHSDDVWRPERLARLVPVLDEGSVVVGGVESGFELMEPGVRLCRGPWLEGADGVDVLSYRAHVHISTLLFRTELARAVRFDEALRNTEDRDFIFRFLSETTLAFVADDLVVIDRRNTGLRDADHASGYEYLYAKHRDVITSDRAVDAYWQLRIIDFSMRSGNLAPARRAARRLVRIAPGRTSRWPLVAGSYLPDSGFVAIARARAELAKRLGR
jgi:glycosyltransferase involved in cell wall biosynthesis